MYRKNTASQYLGFVAVKAADGTAMTGLTIGSFGKYRSIDGGTQASCTGTISETANGQYVIALSQADTNGNDISFLFTYTGMIPVEKTIVTTAADPTDGVHFGLTSLPNAAAGASGGLPLSVDASGRVDVLKVNGTSQTARDLGASVLLSAGTGTGQLDFTSGVVKSSLVQILGTALTETTGYIAAAFKAFFNIASPVLTTASVNQTGDAYNVVKSGGAGDASAIKTQTDKMAFTVANKIDSNVYDWNGTVVATPATAGIPDVNVKNMNNVAATSITAINANQGTTQPVNFTGTGASALIKGDTVDWNGTAVHSPGTAGIPDVNLVNIANAAVATGTAQLGVNVVTQANIDFGSTQKASITAAVPTVASIQSGLATPTNITAGTITTVTTLTNAPSDSSGVTTLLGRVVGTLAAGTHNPQSGDSYARLGAPSGATIEADIAAIKSDTGAIKTDVLLIPTTPLLAGSYVAPDNSDIAAIKLKTDNLPASPAAVGSAMTLSGDLTSTMKTSVTTAASAVTPVATLSGNLPSGMKTDVENAVWNATGASHAVAGSTGAELSSASAPSAATVAAAVWDEQIAGHLGGGKTGAALNAAGSSDDPWTTPLPGAYGAGTAGNIIGSDIPAIKTVTDAIKASGGGAFPFD